MIGPLPWWAWLLILWALVVAATLLCMGAWSRRDRRRAAREAPFKRQRLG